MALCACSTSAAADEENKPAETTKTEEKESMVNAEDSVVANSEENETINEEVNEFGISESELDSLYKKMSETVIIEYL